MNFYLNRASIILKCYPVRGEKPFTYYTGIRIEPSFWSKHSQRVFERHSQAIQLNQLLAKLKESTKSYIIDTKAKGEQLSYDALTDYLDGVTKNKNQNPGFKEYAETWLYASQPNISTETFRNRKSKLKMIFKMFPNLEFHHFTGKWVKEATVKFSAKYQKNTYSKYFQILKQILQEAKKDKVFTLEVPEFQISYESSKSAIYLDVEAVNKLFNHNYKDLYLRNAVNLWMAMYLTGCRYGDLKKILKEKTIQIKGEDYIRFYQGKTKNPVSIPLSGMLKEIREKSHHIAGSNINEYIKIAAKEADIENYHLVTCHTARRSIITNLVLNGMPLKQVMDLSGHKTEKELMKYIRYSDLMAAQKINESPVYQDIINSITA